MHLKNMLPLFLLLALLPACSGDEISTTDFGPAGILWKLQSFRLTDGTVIDVPDPESYTVLFQRNGLVDLRADCNICGGEYALGGGLFRMIILTCTEAICPPGSLDTRYIVALNAALSFHMEGNVLALTYPGGVMVFHA